MNQKQNPEPAAPQQERTARDVLYVVEHKREGEWRRHIGDNSISFLESLAADEATKIKRNFPDAEVRVWPYYPKAEQERAAEPLDNRYYWLVKNIQWHAAVWDLDVP